MNNNLISREALKRAACVKFYTTPYYKHILDLIDNAPSVDRQAINAEWLKAGIEYAETHSPQGKWIPVSERLPEENGEYLVTREAYTDRENRNMVFVRDISNFTIGYRLNNGFHKVNTVIAWQPLPEPYKKAEWICPNCDLYEHTENDYCQYAGECTIGCHECRYFEQKGGAE